jgi:endogenous inhibitor of DNA gyrase (YacG/DUF329 family)
MDNVKKRKCIICGKPMIGLSPKAVYCGQTCRQKAWRIRNGQTVVYVKQDAASVAAQ